MFKKFRHKIDINENDIDDEALLLAHKKLNIKDLEYSNGFNQVSGSEKLRCGRKSLSKKPKIKKSFSSLNGKKSIFS